jgi:hypothetical protein
MKRYGSWNVFLALSVIICAVNDSSWRAFPTPFEERPSANGKDKTRACDGDGYCTSATNHTLYLGPSTLNPDFSNVFAGQFFAAGDYVTAPEMAIPVVDRMAHEYSPLDPFLHSPADIWPQLLLETEFRAELFIPGLSDYFFRCSEEFVNIELVTTPSSPTLWNPLLTMQQEDPVSSSATMEAMAPRIMPTYSAYRALRDIEPGEELFTICDFEEDSYDLPEPPRVPVEALAEEENSAFVGLGNLEMRRSTIPDAGRGSFTRRFVSAGQAVSRRSFPCQPIAAHRTVLGRRRFDRSLGSTPSSSLYHIQRHQSTWIPIADELLFWSPRLGCCAIAPRTSCQLHQSCSDHKWQL